MKTIDRCCTKKSQKPSDFEEQYKLNRVQTSKELLERYKLEGDGFSTSFLLQMKLGLVTSYLKPKDSPNSGITSFPLSLKNRHNISQKIMATVLREHKGMILIEYPAQEETISAARYCETLKKSKKSNQSNRKGIPTKTVDLLHAMPDRAQPTPQNNSLTRLGWTF